MDWTEILRLIRINTFESTGILTSLLIRTDEAISIDVRTYVYVYHNINMTFSTTHYKKWTQTKRNGDSHNIVLVVYFNKLSTIGTGTEAPWPTNILKMHFSPPPCKIVDIYSNCTMITWWLDDYYICNHIANYNCNL